MTPKVTKSSSARTVAEAFIEAFASGDEEALRSYFHDDITFVSPQVQLSGAEQVLAAMKEFGAAVKGVSNVSVVGEGDRAMIMYDMETGPFGTLRAVDNIVVKDGKIVSDDLVFDTYEVRKAMEAQSS